ncbi:MULTISPECIES: GGDEF domain-containing protein [unclassified Streptomyces]|uniref:GGDEF domain-containing protein n=1 Tax=unclassified Streptomyces TaxID=2593676 RepID=UPI0028FD323D|nr:GGDEF domain-containing protein [Streptomyces sp. PAL114]MDU0301913.1 GGDEF domain-containing protein [Streptomyces sp. PAL114]
MPATAVLRQPPRTLIVTAAAVPFALALLADDVRVRRQLHAARRDPLSGLPGRADFLAYGDRLLRTGRRDRVYLMLLDVDHFKQINDTHGHAAGDRVLAVTAQRLTAWAGSHGAVGQLGGDEFAATVRIGSAHRRLRLDELAATFAQPVDLGDGRLVDVAVSVGAAAPDMVGTTDLSGLQRAADAAMYAGKHTGQAILADRSHATVPSVNSRRIGRPGTHSLGAAT